jgi:hypothetical protein
MAEKRMVFTTDKIEDIRNRFDQGDVIPRHEKYWFGNLSQVKRSELTFQLSDEEIMENVRCKLGYYDEDGVYKSGIQYFSEKYCKIKREDGSIGPLRLRDYQESILELYANNRFSVLCGSRQIGKCVQFDTVVRVSGHSGGAFREMDMYQIYHSHLGTTTIYDKMKFAIYGLIKKVKML